MRLCYPNAVNKSVNVTIKLWLKKKKNTKIIQAVTDTTQTLENSDKNEVKYNKRANKQNSAAQYKSELPWKNFVGKTITCHLSW